MNKVGIVMILISIIGYMITTNIQRLKEESKLENSPRDIGLILKEINKDIESEQKEDVKEFLWNEHKREIFANATRGLPEWYKERLLNSSFDGEPTIGKG